MEVYVNLETMSDTFLQPLADQQCFLQCTINHFKRRKFKATTGNLVTIVNNILQ